MNSKINYKTILAVALWIAPMAFANAATLPLFTGSDCTALGGQWSPAAVGSGQLGTCNLPSGFVVARGDTLEIGPSVVLDANARGLGIDGTVNLLDDATLRSSNNGIIENRGDLYLDNKAHLHVDQAWFSNLGNIRAEGDITNEKGSGTITTWAFYNSGVIELFDGGHFINNGEFLDLTTERYEENDESVIVDLNGTFTNRSGARTHARNFVIHGDFVNNYGAELLTRKHITVSSVGKLQNSGAINVWSTAGHFRIDAGGNLTSAFGSTISNDGATMTVNGKLILESATLHNYGNFRNTPNYGPGTIHVGSNGLLHATRRSYLTNHSGAIIDNMGSVVLDCFVVYTNNGSVQGNAVSRSYCFDPGKIDPPPVINWL